MSWAQGVDWPPLKLLEVLYSTRVQPSSSSSPVKTPVTRISRHELEAAALEPMVVPLTTALAIRISLESKAKPLAPVSPAATATSVTRLFMVSPAAAVATS